MIGKTVCLPDKGDNGSLKNFFRDFLKLFDLTQGYDRPFQAYSWKIGIILTDITDLLGLYY